MGIYWSTTKSKRRKNNYQQYEVIVNHISVHLKVYGSHLPFSDDFQGILEIMVTEDDGKKPEIIFHTDLTSSECKHEDAEPAMIKRQSKGSMLVFSLTTKRRGQESETFQIKRVFDIGVHTFRVLENSGTFNRQDNQDNVITLTVEIEKMQSAIQCLDKDSLCKEESQFVSERTKIVLQNMQNKFKGKIHHLEDVPNIAIIGSGGGLRSVVGLSGAMTALQNTNVLDYVMYTAGLSGSAWYLMTLYASGYNFDKTDSSNAGIKIDPKQVNEHICNRLVNFKGNILELAQDILLKKKKEKYVPSGKYITVANTFGIHIGDLLLEQKCKCYWNELAGELNKGNVPLPLIAAVHVRVGKTLKAHHEWIEFSPYQVYKPRFGVAIGMEDFGKTFNAGYVSDKRGRQPIHFLLGICGSAYTIFRDYRPSGYAWITATPGRTCLRELIYLLFNKFDKYFVGRVPNFLYGIDEIRKLPDVTDEEEIIWKMYLRMAAGLLLRIGIAAPFIWLVTKGVEPKFGSSGSFWHWYYRELIISIWDLFKTFAGHVLQLFTYMFGDDQCFENQETDWNDLNEKEMMLVDAGISFNSPYPAVLRPTRKVDLIFSFDFSDRGKDTNWPFEELEKAANWARKRHIPFPDIRNSLRDIRVNWNLGIYKDMYIFPGYTNEQPTVVHFVMINTCDPGKGKFDIHSNYRTLKFNYSEEEFKKLNLLFQHQVEKNSEMIERCVNIAIMDKIRRNAAKRKIYNR